MDDKKHAFLSFIDNKNDHRAKTSPTLCHITPHKRMHRTVPYAKLTSIRHLSIKIAGFNPNCEIFT